MSGRKQWFKLDNAAKLYPPTRTRNWTAMFRLSAALREEVDPRLLEQALERTLRRFPPFACRLRKGFFWYYLEHIDGAPPVLEDVRNPMTSLGKRENGRFMFRVRYFGTRISVEFFHVLTDGGGSLTFLLTLVKEYLRLSCGAEIPCGPYLLDCDETPSPEEFEDSYLRYARKETIARKDFPAYRVQGTVLPLHQILITSGTVSTERLMAEAKKYGVSMGIFLASVLVYALSLRQREESSPRRRKLPIRISVPVNLRRFYPSRTIRNFAAFVDPGIDSRLGEYSFEEVLTQVKCWMTSETTEKRLNAKFSGTVAIERNLIVRLVPLFVKKPIMKLCYYLQGDRHFTSTMSNLGAVRLPEEMRCHVERLDAFLGPSSDPRSECACVSYNGRTALNFTRSLYEPDVERHFFTTLIKMGIPVLIESNGRCM